MESTYSTFVFEDSLRRIDEILNSNDAEYKELNTIPQRNTLTFTNGFYVYCCALFVDMRGSKLLSEKHKNPTLAKIYRSYISELVALFRDHRNVKEISIEGDCVWGIFDAPDKKDIDLVFSTAASASSIVDILNYKFSKRQISHVTVGIGMSYGRALMIKAGYKNSGVNDVTWMGALVAEAASLCSHGSRGFYNKETMVSEDFYSNLNNHNQRLLAYSPVLDCYHGDVIDTSMNNWLKVQQR